MKGTLLVVCAVKGSPVSGSIIMSALPWSAVMSAAPPVARTASTTLATHLSTVRTASSAASSTPVWPTMSQLAKFRIMTSYLPLPMSSTAFSVTSFALMSGLRS